MIALYLYGHDILNGICRSAWQFQSSEDLQTRQIQAAVSMIPKVLSSMETALQLEGRQASKGYVCRVRDAMALQLEGGGSSSPPAQTPNLVGEVLGRARTPRWLGDPYGVDEQGPQAMGPDRVSLPNIAARSRSGPPLSVC